MTLTREQMQRANELSERIIGQQRKRIADLESALHQAEQLLDDGGHNNRVAAQDILAASRTTRAGACCCRRHKTNQAGTPVDDTGHASVSAFSRCLNCPTHGTGQPSVDRGDESTEGALRDAYFFTAVGKWYADVMAKPLEDGAHPISQNDSGKLASLFIAFWPQVAASLATPSTELERAREAVIEAAGDLLMTCERNGRKWWIRKGTSGRFSVAMQRLSEAHDAALARLDTTTAAEEPG